MAIIHQPGLQFSVAGFYGRRWESLSDALPDGDFEVHALLVAESFCDQIFFTLLDHVHWYDGPHATYLRHRGVGMTSSPSDLKIVFRGTSDPHDPSNLLGQRC
jgi:hypothetical protein